MRTPAPHPGRSVKIDIHAHFFPEISQEESQVLGIDDAPWLRVDNDQIGMIMAGNNEYRPVQAPLWDPQARLAEMDANGVDIQVVSATPILFSYVGDPDRTARWAAQVNDAALEMCAAAPQRLRPLCQVPLQDIDRACAEVTRAVAAGHVGVHIGNHVDGRNLDHPALLAFLHHCADQGIPVLVHPWSMMAAERMPKYMLQWLVGMPAETHLAILSLILSGAFERLPAYLKICFAHGGGNFAQQLGRVENAWHRRDIVRQDCPRPPSEYVERFSVDSAVFDDTTLRFLLDVMGESRVLMGSDYPFPLGEIHPGKMIEESPLFSDATRQAVLYDNAANFFGVGND